MAYIEFRILGSYCDEDLIKNKDIQKAKDIFIDKIQSEKSCSGYDEYFIRFDIEYDDKNYLTAQLLGNIDEVVYGEGICTERIRTLRKKKKVFDENQYNPFIDDVENE